MAPLRERVQLHQVNEENKSGKLNGNGSSLLDYAIDYLFASFFHVARFA